MPAAHCRPPPLSVIVPEPKLFAALKLIRPPVTVVPPVYVLAAVRTVVPGPICRNELVPEMTPPKVNVTSRVAAIQGMAECLTRR